MDMHFDGVLFQTYAGELARRMKYAYPAAVVLDIRPAADFALGHVPGARSVTVSRLLQGLPDGVAAGTEIFVLGEDSEDTMVRRASHALQAAGAARIVEFPGGMSEWRTAGMPVEKGAAEAA